MLIEKKSQVLDQKWPLARLDKLFKTSTKKRIFFKFLNFADYEQNRQNRTCSMKFM